MLFWRASLVALLALSASCDPDAVVDAGADRSARADAGSLVDGSVVDGSVVDGSLVDGGPYDGGASSSGGEGGFDCDRRGEIQRGRSYCQVELGSVQLRVAEP